MQIQATWDMGTEYATRLLETVNLVSKSREIKKVETEDFTVYWSGSILRVDMKESSFRG